MAGGSNLWGALVKSIREEQGISQRQLAERCGLSRSTVRRIESLNGTGHIHTVERVLNLLGYELEAMTAEGARHKVKQPGKKSAKAVKKPLITQETRAQ